ncbi:hypothetical protein BJX76DRAFT_352201 [Aspergillus varians]
MAPSHRNRSQPSAPEPEHDGLEIRCTWSGEYEEVSYMRISLKVKCVPSTQLQLLDLRRPGIFFEDSFLERLPQTENDTDNEEETDTPQSPLFGFSPLVHDGNRDIGLDPPDDSMFDDICIPKAEPILEENEEALATSESRQHDPKARDTEPVTEPVLGRFVPPLSSANTPSSSHHSEFGGLTRSRKRSATDAEFPDSGSDGDDERGGELKDVTNRKTWQLNAVGPTGIGDRDKGRTVSGSAIHKEIACPRSPRRSASTKIPDIIIPNENAAPRSPDKLTDVGAWTTEKPRTLGQSLSKGKQNQGSSLIPKRTSTDRSEASASASTIDTAVEIHLANERAPENYAATVGGTVIKSARETRVRFQIPCDKTTETESSDGQLLSLALSKKLEPADFERRGTECKGINDETRSGYAPRDQGETSPHWEHAHVENPKSSDQPEVKVIDGFVTLKNSERVHPATFKLTITAAIFIMPPNDKGWSDLEIPGIPRTGGGRIGILLFLMPVCYGLEIRTTNLNRATIVENCLVAEFVNAGNLVIPLRHCDREFCGNISDFTVDQEIISHSIAKTAATSNRSVIQMRCHAVCSVRLYNRCFWSERCTIHLYVDGGPNGFFECDVTSQTQAMKKILIMTKENTSMGVSRVKVTCSPKDVDMLYVRWAMEFPGQRAVHWVPRIYPASSRSHERRQDCLRYALLEVLNDPLYLCSGTETTEVECESDNELTPSYEHIEILPTEVSEDPKPMPSQPVPKWPILPWIKRAVQLELTRHYRNPDYFLKQLLRGVLCLAFLGVGFVISASSSHNSRQSLSSLREAPPQTSEQTGHISWFPSPSRLLKNNQENVEDHESSAISLSTLDTVRKQKAIDIDPEETKAFVRNEGEQSKESVMMETGVYEPQETPVSFRDKIDYWLGWTGPV